MRKTFTVTGTVIRAEYSEHVVTIEEANTMKPVMLRVYGEMMKYLDEQSFSDAEEKYMPLNFIYDEWCMLVAIMVPSRTSIPAKTVLFRDSDLTVHIYGEQDIINTPKPEPMSRREWYTAIEAARSTLNIRI